MEKEHDPSIRRMKLLIFSSLYPEDESDMSNVFEKRFNHYLKERCDISVAAFSSKTRDAYQVDGIDVFPVYVPEKKEYLEKNFLVRRMLYWPQFFYREILRFIRSYSVLNRLHKKNQYDALFVASFSIFGIYILPFTKRFKIPLFAQCSGYDIQTIPSIGYGIRRKRWFQYYSDLVLRHADLLLPLSRGFVEDTLLKGIDTPKYVLSRGVDSNEFKLSKKRKSKDLLPRIEILSVGGLRKVKGWELTLKVAELLKHHENIRFTIIGREDDFKEFRQIIEEKGLENVEFKGKVSPDKMKSYYEMADIYFHPSLSEGLGNAMLEASAMELPIVASGLGGVKDILVDGYNGYYIGSRRPEAFAEKILYLVHHPEKRLEMGRNARKRVRENYDWEKIVEDFFAFLEQYLRPEQKRH